VILNEKRQTGHMQASQLQFAGYSSKYAKQLDWEDIDVCIVFAPLLIGYLKSGNLNQPTLATDEQCRAVKLSGIESKHSQA
jgi:hypothetical protein